MLDRIRNQARRVDQRLVRDAIDRETKARDAGIERNRNTFMFGKPSEMAQVVGGLDNLDEAQTSALQLKMERQVAGNNAQLYRQGMADQYAPRMNRGLGGLTQMSIAEKANNLIANNAYVRRGALPAAVAGGGLLAGAALTEGAQQLMALMGFIQQGQQQEQRTEQSPLAQQPMA